MSLPQQRIAFNQKTKQWRKDTLDHYDTLWTSINEANRSSRYTKRINYNLYNGKFNRKDLEYVCNPLGLDNQEFPATLQHYDITSASINLLLGEEAKRPDNCIVISESPNDINRKESKLKEKLVMLLQDHLMAEIDPSTIDPNNPPPPPEQIVKYERHNVSDMVESQANKMLKYVRKYNNTKEVFKKGFKDALISGEEIYWTGVLNGEVSFRRCNPLNITVVLDSDSDFVDDAIAVIEERMMTISSIVDEFGDILSPDDILELEGLKTNALTRFSGVSSEGAFTLNVDNNGNLGVQDTGSSWSNPGQSSGGSHEHIRVLRVEWKSFKKLYHLSYTDEDGIIQEMIVDEIFKLDQFKEVYPDAKTTTFWVNEAWEGIKIHDTIYIGIQPKQNQRRRMNNPYYCKLGYTGLIYNSTNSTSVSVVDRIKPYQYLFNIIWYRLELAFAQDQGKKVVVDLAQIPRSEGIDIEKWMYYLKAMGIMFINSFEEQKKGSHIGKYSSFNQFSSIDLSMANTIQGYIDSLDYIKSQVASVSGVSPQRLGAINSQELVGNVEKAVTQSALITEYLFDSHDEVKRRVYTSLVECAKIAFRNGKQAQFVLDDMGIEMLNIEEFEFENSEFNVYMSNSNKDQKVVETLKMLAIEAIKADKADLSTIIDTVINDNPRDISAAIKKGEMDKYQRDKQASDIANNIEQQKVAVEQQRLATEIDERQKDRDLALYKIDTDNQTKIMTAEISALSGKDGPSDMDGDGIPDPVEIARLSLDERDLASKNFLEQTKLRQEKDKHDKEMSKKDKEISVKKEIEDKKIQAIKEQNKSQEKMQKEDHKLKREELSNKIKVENIKLQIAKSKAAEAKKKAKQTKKK